MVKEKSSGNAGKALLIGTIIILAVAFSNAIGYIGSAITDPKNWYIWGIIAVAVFLIGAIAGMKELEVENE